LPAAGAVARDCAHLVGRDQSGAVDGGVTEIRDVRAR
jgi:hypothetical protein